MKKNCRFLFISLWMLCLCVFQAHAKNDSSLIQRADVKAFMQEMVRKHQFNEAQLKQWFSQAQIQPSIIETMTKPAEKLPWYKYEKIFLGQQRVQEGANFWRQHSATLAKAQKQYGVPPEIIIAIIGVESFYGKHAGKHRVMDALVTLGFDYPPRSKFFLSELEEFLLLAREEHWDPNSITGSYAGAMGNPQFISSSYRRFAVDFDNNGKRDLIGSLDDAIGSVAHYFSEHGWEKNGPVVYPASAQGTRFQDLIASKTNPKPTHTLKTMSQQGVRLNAGLKSQPLQNRQFALVALEKENGSEYWLAGQNFYVITRYNHSDHYAMAVYNLSQKIKQAYKTST